MKYRNLILFSILARIIWCAYAIRHQAQFLLPDSWLYLHYGHDAFRLPGYPYFLHAFTLPWCIFVPIVGAMIAQTMLSIAMIFMFPKGLARLWCALDLGLILITPYILSDLLCVFWTTLAAVFTWDCLENRTYSTEELAALFWAIPCVIRPVMLVPAAGVALFMDQKLKYLKWFSIPIALVVLRNGLYNHQWTYSNEISTYLSVMTGHTRMLWQTPMPGITAIQYVKNLAAFFFAYDDIGYFTGTPAVFKWLRRGYLLLLYGGCLVGLTKAGNLRRVGFCSWMIGSIALISCWTISARYRLAMMPFIFLGWEGLI